MRADTVSCVYKCSKGMVYVGGDGLGVKVFSNVRYEKHPADGVVLAICECFALAGQGDSDDSAVMSLSSVLSNHLGFYHSIGQLEKVLDPKFWTKHLASEQDSMAMLDHLTKLMIHGRVVVAEFIGSDSNEFLQEDRDEDLAGLTQAIG